MAGEAGTLTLMDIRPENRVTRYFLSVQIMMPLSDIALQERLQPLLAAPAPAWLWDFAQGAILWANRSGVAFWGEVDLVRLTERRFDRAMPAVARLRSLAEDDFGKGEITATLLFWTDGSPHEIACSIDMVVLDSGQRALLVIECGGEGAAKIVSPDRRLNGSEDSAGSNDAGDQTARLTSVNSDHLRSRRPPRPFQNLDDQDRIALEEIASLVRAAPTPCPEPSSEVRTGRTTANKIFTDGENGRDAGQKNSSPDAALFAERVRQAAQTLFETLPVGFCICRNGEMIFANSVLAYAFGYDTPHALLKAGGLNALFPKESVFAKSGDGSAEPVFRTKIVTARSRSGRRHEVCVLLGETLFDPKPVQTALILPLSWSGYARTREALLPSFANDAVRQLVDGLMTLDRNGCLLDADTILDVPLEDFTGRHLSEIFLKQDWPKISRALHRLERRAPMLGQAEILQTCLRAGASSIGPIGLRLGRLDEEGAARYWAALVDLRQMQTREPEKKETPPAHHAVEDKAAADVLAKISHEVRTPLNSIIGFAEIMKDERFGPVGHAKYRGYLNDIYDSAHHALSLINDLLDISKLKAGVFEAVPSPVDVNRTIKQCLRTLGPQAEQARIVIRTSLAAGLPPLSVDERSLKQILLNLVSNGIKFTDAGGHVIVQTLKNEDGGLKIRVRDTGIGMSDDEITQAVQPFLQLDTAPRQQIGSGLGLPLAKALAEASGASFSIASTPGKGTQVDLDFAADMLLPERLKAGPGKTSAR